MTTAAGVPVAGMHAPTRIRDAWTAFWADPAQSRCASGAPAIWQSLERHWFDFARRLPPGARVLDLGCGAGVVGRMLLAARGDLLVRGVDAAIVPHSTVPRMELLSQTDMEALPYEDGSFAAVVSQFGYEYSDTERSARELTRVLAPGAPLSLLVHHSESAIVGATRERLGAVIAFLSPTLRSSFCSGDAAAFGSELTLLVQRYPDDELIAQLARELPSRLGGLREKRVTTWATLEEVLAPERSTSDSLTACCVAPAQIDARLEPLRAVCALETVTVLREADGTPIAWRISGTSAPPHE